MNETTYYIRDAQGNVMATYLNKNVDENTETYHLTERPIYGSSRLGMLREKVNMLVTPPAANAMRTMRYGLKHYELTNHLGKVTTILTGQKVPFYENTFLTYKPQIVQSMDYSPFGVTRLSYNITPVDVNNPVEEGYRYGFNGKEKDDEVSGKGNQYDYGFRIYNPRLGRFLSTDPLFKNYPMLTTYQFASNTPIRAIDLDGLEAISVEGYIEKGVVVSVTQNFDLDGEDARIHYRIHNMSTGSTEDLWVHPTEIKYEPSAGERFMTGAREAGEYASSKFKSLDRIMYEKARGRPTYEGVDGFKNGGAQMMLGTLGVIVSGGSLIVAETSFGSVLAAGSLLTSADDISVNPDGTTMLGRTMGDQDTANRLKLGINVASFSTGLKSTINNAVKGDNPNLGIDVANIINDEINVLNGINTVVEKTSDK